MGEGESIMRVRMMRPECTEKSLAGGVIFCCCWRAAAVDDAGTHAIATNGGAAAQNQAVSVQDSQPPKKVHAKRLYFIDWLRTFLTVLVLVHHTWSTYVPNGGDTYWWVLTG